MVKTELTTRMVQRVSVIATIVVAVLPVRVGKERTEMLLGTRIFPAEHAVQRIQRETAAIEVLRTQLRIVPLKTLMIAKVDFDIGGRELKEKLGKAQGTA